MTKKLQDIQKQLQDKARTLKIQSHVLAKFDKPDELFGALYNQKFTMSRGMHSQVKFFKNHLPRDVRWVIADELERRLKLHPKIEYGNFVLDNGLRSFVADRQVRIKVELSGDVYVVDLVLRPTFMHNNLSWFKIPVKLHQFERIKVRIARVINLTHPNVEIKRVYLPIPDINDDGKDVVTGSLRDVYLLHFTPSEIVFHPWYKVNQRALLVNAFRVWHPKLCRKIEAKYCKFGNNVIDFSLEVTKVYGDVFNYVKKNGLASFQRLKDELQSSQTLVTYQNESSNKKLLDHLLHTDSFNQQVTAEANNFEDDLNYLFGDIFGYDVPSWQRWQIGK